MRLITKTTLYYLLFTLPLLLLSGWFLYSRIQVSLKEEVGEELESSKEIWITHFNTFSQDTGLMELNNPFVQIIKSDSFTDKSFFSDTMLYELPDKELVPYRKLTFWIKKDQQAYRVSLQRSVLEQDDVFQNLFLIMCIVFGGILLLFLIINLYINKKVWRPFNTSLEKITSINMQHMEAVQFEKVSVKEFNELNKALNKMVVKMNSDFTSMKKFTENASHEIQTPLAIIQSKLELLLQQSNLSQEQFSLISSAGEATQRLSRLNQSLLLITRIENYQYKATKRISLGKVIEENILLFKELSEQKDIKILTELTQDWDLFINESLAEMLISNLLINAIKYNHSNGKIKIELTQNTLSISNTSDAVMIENTSLFKRFSSNSKSTGNGLGLAIVKEICDTNNLNIMYKYSENMHRFIIKEK